jgi:hypothetical protein
MDIYTYNGLRSHNIHSTLQWIVILYLINILKVQFFSSSKRNISDNYYMSIQILQSKDQLLTSGARPVVGGLPSGVEGRLWRVQGMTSPHGMDRYHRLYIFLVSHPPGFIAS